MSFASNVAKRVLAKSATSASSASAASTFSSSSSTAIARRTFTSSVRRQGDHGSQYDPSGGWLFGVKPGEKYKPEGWEKPFFWGFCGSLIVFVCVLPFKPDTSIQTWALEEARRRLEVEGILPDPFPNSKQ
ncbi:nadh ubiquinone oxidoreductase subunit [Ophiostoma piceae UAMH 11346]|uniref:NADH dehydrogenase [ubiquinone] 1 beta subcomplex subunit 11, mitochondrial n=1 Tax=Ophiostoma piceae (strain UAMH 11346) TaxID=1262450 RepID=S3BUA4_OPHP1|nr:nadh ubiquinone oxidoreductase subunit [Ophiostoma piceae UAMH 11346]